ncbi:MAG: LamG-like jellyroll fold domain-containing protein [Sedimentisphaerales bacterium]
MSKKFVFSSFVLVLFLVASTPAWASMTYAGDCNLHGQFGNFDGGGNYLGGDWPDFNGVPDLSGWSKIGTKNGVQPKAKTVNDPNQLPAYANDFGPGTIRVFYTPVNGGSNTQTFSTDGNTDGFALTRIAIRVSGGIDSTITPDQNHPFSVHIFDVCDAYGYVPPAAGSIVPADARPYGGSVDFLSGPYFTADPCIDNEHRGLLGIGSWDSDVLMHLDFSDYDRVDLEPNHTYAFEVWGPVGWASAPPYIWGMVWNSQEDTSKGTGCGYQVSGTTNNGNGPGASNLTNPRGMALGGPAVHSFVVGVYGDYADGNAYHPEPRKYQTGVSLTPTLTWHPGKWADVNVNDVNGGHQVWFSTSFNFVAQRKSSANKGRVQNPSYVITSPLALNTDYYWRVDEYNDVNTVTVPRPNLNEPNRFWGEANNISGDTTDRPTIWRFRTISPSAFNPVPATGTLPQQATFKPQSALLSWTKGALAADVDGHRVYFGTSWGDVNHASEANGAPLYRGKTTDPNYPLKNLFPDYTLTSGTAYYWRVDEVNAATAGSPWKGTVWNFKMPNPAFISIDDFSSSADFAKAWQTSQNSTISVAGNVMTMNYDNSGSTYSTTWSEAMFDYSYVSSTGIDWTLGGVFVPKALGVQFDACAVGNTLWGDNAPTQDPNYGKMYMGIADAAGHSGFVTLKSDLYAAQRAITITSGNAAIREFKVALNDSNFSDVNLKSISKVFLGIGVRGSQFDSKYAGKGSMKFANLKVYVSHCNPTYPLTSMVAGDLGGPHQGNPITSGDNSRYTTPDCVVNYHDIYYFASDWLYNEPNLVYDSNVDPTTANLTAWYKFENADGNNIINDDSGNGRHGTLYNAGPFTWSYTGHNGTGKCVNLEPGYHTWIECPNTVVPGTGTGQSFTFWLNHNDSFLEEHIWASVLVFHSSSPGVTGGALGDNQTMETQLAVPIQPPGGGAPPWLRWVDMRISKETGLQHARPSLISSKWNHYALVYDTSVNPDPNISPSMKMYVNGVPLVALADATITRLWGPNETGDGNANTVRIGQRSDANDSAITNGWGFWQGRIDDMRLYSKALSDAEVQYLATDGTGKRNRQAVFNEPTNFNSNNTVTLPTGPTVKIVNFNDFAVLAGYWLNQQLWP